MKFLNIYIYIYIALDDKHKNKYNRSDFYKWRYDDMKNNKII